MPVVGEFFPRGKQGILGTSPVMTETAEAMAPAFRVSVEWLDHQWPKRRGPIEIGHPKRFTSVSRRQEVAVHKAKVEHRARGGRVKRR